MAVTYDSLQQYQLNALLNRIRPKNHDRNEHRKQPFKPKNLRISTRIDDFRHFFRVENIPNLPNSSRQYLVKSLVSAIIVVKINFVENFKSHNQYT